MIGAPLTCALHDRAKHRIANPAANHAAEAVVIYPLQRAGRYTGDVGPILVAPAPVASR